LELFGAANLALGARTNEGGRSRRFDCHLLGRKRRVLASHGIVFSTRPAVRRYDAIVVPSVWGASREEFFERLERLAREQEMLRELSPRAAILASACSGAVLLAGAGLLDGHRATTCWWLADWFRQRFAGVELLPDRLVVADGTRWTSAAGSAYMHLGLQLVRRLADEAAAGYAARLMLVERRRGSQSPFLPPPRATAAAADEQMLRVLRHLDEHGATPLSIAALCRAIGIHERTLVRKFHACFGLSPLAYLQSRRIALARQLLETSSLPLEAIVTRCGYEDVSSFRKLFSRLVGMTPREYRSRFGG
jgi:transcriptional regulator GlxA family with amidase domain